MTPRPLAIVLALIAARPAYAENDIAKADKLFDEGRALMNTDLHAACEKFEESLKWNSQAIGTLLNVALCDEKLGRLASAAARFAEARDRAKEGNMAVHLEAAEERLKEVLPRVPHVTIKLAAPVVPGTRIVLDDKVLAADGLVDIPVDPGERALVVSAPDHVAFQTSVRIAEGEHRDVEVPVLRQAVTVSSRKTVGKIVTIAGGATLVTGVVIGMVAFGRYDDQIGSHCVESTLECDPEGLSATRSARTLGTVGTVVGAIGVAGVGVGLYLWLRSPSPRRETGVTLLPQLDPGAPGVAAVGRF